MTGIAAQLSAQYPVSNGDKGIAVVPIQEVVVGDTRQTLLVLLAAVAFVLLIACANVANLLLARAAARGRELVVRAAVGAGRLRLIRQMLTESAVLALMSGAAGVLITMIEMHVSILQNDTGLSMIDLCRPSLPCATIEPSASTTTRTPRRAVMSEVS